MNTFKEMNNVNQDQTPLSQHKKIIISRAISLLLLAFSLAFILYALYLAILLLYYTLYLLVTDTLTEMALITDGWKQPIITDFLWRKQNCPANYQKKLFWQWPGTQVGCKCKVKQSYLECSSQLLGFNCSTLPALPPVKVYKWKGMVLCLLKPQGLNFSYSASLNCINLCGNSDERFCSFDVPCPVSEFQGSELPIVQTELRGVSECKNYELERTKPACLPPHPLNQKTSSQQLDTFLSYNPQLKNAWESLPNFFVDINEYPQLDIRRVANWSYSCRLNSELSIPTVLEKTSLKGRLTQVVLLFLSQLTFLSMALTGTIYKVFKLYKKSEQKSRNLVVRYLDFFLMLGLAILIATTSLGTVWDRNQALWFNQAAACTSKPLLSFIDTLQNYYYLCYRKGVQLLIWVSVQQVCLLFIHLKQICRCERKVQGEQTSTGDGEVSMAELTSDRQQQTDQDTIQL